ncbi:MAG: class I SAM-dependent methyltransferase [Clostridiales bacterium]|nr:class I SAM-dependent methyltransferase [Clostridiales bacterium]
MDFASLGYDAFMYYFEKRGLEKLRSELLSGVNGNVLELGPGTGINLQYYNRNIIESLTYIDIKFKPSLEEKAKKICPSVTLIQGDAEKLPFADKTFDSVVFTLVFCSVINPRIGLEEVKRVLKDDGKIYFMEHVEPHKGWMKPVFNKINPAWHSFSGGCNLNRNTFTEFEKAGIEAVLIGKKFNDIFIAGVGIKKMSRD